jgi:hypothetical protein
MLFYPAEEQLRIDSQAFGHRLDLLALSGHQ